MSVSADGRRRDHLRRNLTRSKRLVRLAKTGDHKRAAQATSSNIKQGKELLARDMPSVEKEVGKEEPKYSHGQDESDSDAEQKEREIVDKERLVGL